MVEDREKRAEIERLRVTGCVSETPKRLLGCNILDDENLLQVTFTDRIKNLAYANFWLAYAASLNVSEMRNATEITSAERHSHNSKTT
jgi:hypothetical protein